jgi:hypothetical protein
MKLVPDFRWRPKGPESREEAEAGGEMNHATGAAVEAAGESTEKESHLFRTVGWVSAALGAVALGLFVGRELRVRYKFNRRTPYDVYSHSGDELGDVDWGVGI